MQCISIIITTYEQASRLEEHLPVFIGQDYDNFEIIVVDMNSTDNTKDVLEHLEAENPVLRHITLPDSARDISRERLAITLGIRTAACNRCVITQADCVPQNDQWLKNLSSQWTDDKDIILCKVVRDKSKGFGSKFSAYREKWRRKISERIARKRTPYRTLGPMTGYNRELFLQHNGFASHSNLALGAMDIMVNQNATETNTVVITDRENLVIQDCPLSSHMWAQQRLFDVETRHHLKRRFTHRMYYLGMWICTIPTGGLLVPLWDFADWIRWRFSDKNTFRKKFI